ncbi:HAMP domain-containing protein [Aestuariibacter halophilus]|uniref:histidine kinase n=1 Tax=Fluctibacter halophilus TaxID=226011 RepID=A0ABS8GC30_9ALTE|nr:ATP-binding protein [Aestuariibacter halophilus]MCC2617661.1 HAMP domain-containing protein [Aestuariibacter halophilus]
MPKHSRFLSIKSLFVWVVMAITTLALVLASIISLFSQISSYKAELIDEVNIFAELISRNATSSIAFDDNITEEENLKGLSVAPFIQNVHIYNIGPEEQLAFFASYNKTGMAPIPAMFNRIEELREPILTNSVIEVIRPIRLNGQVLGYTYLRSSAESLDNLTANSITITLTVLVVTILVCFLLTLRLQRAITDPIQQLVNLVQRISRQRDYSGRAEPTSIKELDILAESFNDMLERIQAHMQGQAEAEAEQRRLQSNLEEKVNQRTTALKEANQELIETLEKLHQFQRQMVQNEKMASLGDMVAGVAHEVNTPIGLGVTASTMMLDRLTDLQKEFESKSLKASKLAKFIDEGQENLNIIYRNLNRAAELISSFKQVAVDQSSENSRVFAFSQLMDEILLSLRPRLKKYHHEITLHCDDTLYIETKAGPINQIMINLIMNSVIHGFEFMDNGHIDIFVDLINDGKLNIIYKDNGKGIPEHLRKRIFDPFVTTKRGQGGSGLGMHLVYNLVTQALNGTISITSEENHGVEFQISFPVKRVDAKNIAKSS